MRGSDSVVECHLAKVKVAGSNPVFRSNTKALGRNKLKAFVLGLYRGRFPLFLTVFHH